MRRDAVFRIDRFLGLNQADESQTELKNGEAAKMVNWAITDNGNIRRRPGISRLSVPGLTGENQIITGMWAGNVRGADYVVTTVFYPDPFPEGLRYDIDVYRVSREGLELMESKFVFDRTNLGCPSKIFYLADRLYVALNSKLYEIDPDAFKVTESKPYEPVVLTGTSPAGGGTTLESVNLLSSTYRVQFSADGKASAFKLPSSATGVTSATVDNKPAVGNYANGTFTFNSAPPEGVNNVVITCTQSEFKPDQFYKMPFYEHYNGDTDTRVFFYGDGSNLTLYTGVPAFGKGLYVPAINEIAVSASSSPITGMIRQDATLMCFKTDGAYRIVYSPITLANGKVIAAFYVRDVSKEIGNEEMGQVQLTNNYPRTIDSGTVYEWHSANAYKDQRYTKRVSDPVSRSLRGRTGIITADDNIHKAYYMCLNDGDGTVLVDNYGVGAWTMYQSKLMRNIRFAVSISGSTVFATEKELLFFDEAADFDAPEADGGEPIPIKAVWESGFMHFGADWRKKYSSEIWVSTYPEASSRMTITVNTDRRNGYARKVVGNNIFDWYNDVDYTNWSYNVSRTPKMKRTKIKVKKFVYYKLIFEVESPGAKATVLSADIAVHFAGAVK